MAAPPKQPIAAKKQPTVFILYIPGGAMLGIVPALILSRLEALTETPTPELFQVIEGVSTGSILAAGFTTPGMNARKGAELFVQFGPTFFPEIPGRWGKMSARNGVNIAKHFYRLDPKQSDYLALKNIEQLCDAMIAKNTSAHPDLIYELEKEATERWMTHSRQKDILKICQQIQEQDEGLRRHTEAVAELVASRTFTSRLGIVFKSAALGILDGLKNKWAKKDECLFDPSKPQKAYQQLFGDRKISNGICSTYISAYDIINNRIVTFSSLKRDLFSKDPNAPAIVQNDIKLWDAVMASTANPLAFPPHITETNLLCSDKAPIHRPRSVKDVLSVVPKGTRVVLVVAGTGKYLSKDLMEYMARKNEEETGHLSDVEKYRKKLEVVRDYYVEFGVAGNLVMGREISELEGYTSSDAMDDFKEKLGEENIFNITPRLVPYTPQERAEFPSKDVLDASRDNIKKIIKRGRLLAEEEDAQIRRLAQMLVDNQRLLGRMDDVKYARVSKKIGLKTVAEIEKDTAAGIENRIASNDNSTGIRHLWRSFSNLVVNGTWEEEEQQPPPPPPPPKEPGPT